MENEQNKKSNKIWVVLIIIILGSVVWYVFINKKSANMTDISTAEKIKNLPVVLDDVNGDYLSGSVDTPERIVKAFVFDNSKSNPTYLYLAANSAYVLGDIKSAGFLVFAARIRAEFDKERFKLPDVDGENVVSYWRFLDEKIGLVLNSEILRDPEQFSEIASMIEDWEVLPDDDAYYPEEQFGKAVIAKEEWKKKADEKKQWFMDNFFNKFKLLLANPKYSEALNFVNDYTVGKIPRSEENEPKYLANLRILSEALNEVGLGQ